MKNYSFLISIFLIMAVTLLTAQEMPPKHRAINPRLTAEGKVLDQSGKQLGYIKDGKVCDVSGKVLGVIAKTGEVSYGSKGILGAIQKDGSFKTSKGDVVTTDVDGVVMAAGKEVARVEAGYKEKSHGCVVHCFFSSNSSTAKEIDSHVH